MSSIGKYLCEWGFHKWMDKDALKMINNLLGIEGEYRKCARCDREEKLEHGFTEQYWGIKHKGSEKHDGLIILRILLILCFLSLYIGTIYYCNHNCA